MCKDSSMPCPSFSWKSRGYLVKQPQFFLGKRDVEEKTLLVSSPIYSFESFSTVRIDLKLKETVRKFLKMI